MASSGRDAPRESGALSLEAVLVVPVVAVLVLGLLQVAALGRDVLLLHEAARAGARAAATTTGVAAPRRAARAAVPELPDLEVEVVPAARRTGDLATVTVRATRRLGPVARELSARAVVLVEPTVGG
mgnify:CR=1 FL=1